MKIWSLSQSEFLNILNRYSEIWNMGQTSNHTAKLTPSISNVHRHQPKPFPYMGGRCCGKRPSGRNNKCVYRWHRQIIISSSRLHSQHSATRVVHRLERDHLPCTQLSPPSPLIHTHTQHHSAVGTHISIECILGQWTDKQKQELGTVELHATPIEPAVVWTPTLYIRRTENV